MEVKTAAHGLNRFSGIRSKALSYLFITVMLD
jgi:hypothetical protein